MRRANQEQMEAVVASYQSSGLTQREFCLQQNLKLPTFSYWYRKVSSKPVAIPSGFTEVTAPCARRWDGSGFSQWDNRSGYP